MRWAWEGELPGHGPSPEEEEQREITAREEITRSVRRLMRQRHLRSFPSFSRHPIVSQVSIMRVSQRGWGALSVSMYIVSQQRSRECKTSEPILKSCCSVEPGVGRALTNRQRDAFGRY